MKTTLLVLALACAAAADVPEDGLYVVAEAAGGVRVPGADGRFLLVGDKCAYAVQRARVTARDNANREFDVSLKVPFAEGLEALKHVLVVNGEGWRQTGSGSEANTASWINFRLSGRRAGEVAAELFGVKPELRAHPGHRLAVSFVPAREEFGAGEARIVRLRIENLGTEPVFFQVGGRNRSERDNQFVFRASNGDKALPDIGSDMHFGGLSFIQELKPGEVFEREVDLGKWFALEKAGSYVVHGAYLLSFFDSREYTWIRWEEWVAAEFRVRIGEAEK